MPRVQAPFPMFQYSNPIDIDTVLQANFLGTDTAQSYTAETGQVATFYNSAQIATANAKPAFSSSLLLTTETSDRLTFPQSTALDFDSGNFTFECFFKFNQAIANPYHYGLFQKYTSDGNFWMVSLFNNGGSPQAYLLSSSFNKPWNMPVMPTVGTWYHFACVRNGNNLAFYLDGTQGGSQGITQALPTVNSPMTIGRFDSGAYGGYTAKMNVCGARISRVARYTSSFTPPTIPF